MSAASVVGRALVVPGSISNLGPGFDALSVAVSLYLRATVLELQPSAPDTISFEFDGRAPKGDNRIETAFRLARRRIGRATPGLRVRVQSDIPMRGGLGSSAAATIVGLRLYELLTGPRPDAEWIAMATEVEGHPDNASAAALGGLTVSCQQDNGQVLARSWAWPADLQFVVATPDAELATSLARKALSPTVTMRDAVFNLQRALLLVRALESGRYEDLREAFRDRWHQPARAALVPGLAAALAIDDPSVLGVCLSGAGPSIAAVTHGQSERAGACLGAVYEKLGMPYTIRVLAAHQPSRQQ